MAWLRRWLGDGDSLKGVSMHCLLSGSPRGEHVSWGGTEGPVGGVPKSWLPWGLWGWMRSCKGDTTSQAENLAPVKVYWTPFRPALFTVASCSLQVALAGWRVVVAARRPSSPALLVVQRRWEGGLKEGAGDRSSAPPGALPCLHKVCPRSRSPAAPHIRAAPDAGAAPSRPVLWPATWLVYAG